MARTIASGTPHQDTVATTHTASAGVTKDIERFDATSGALTATLPTAVGIVGRAFTIMKVDSTTNAVNVATTSSQTITGTGGTTDAIVSQGAATTYTSDGANWVTTATAGVPFTDPAADKILYWQNSTKAVKPVTIGTNLTFSSGTLDASGGSGLTVGTTAIASGATSRLLYETSGNVLGELILGTNLSISGGNTLDAAGGGSPTNISTRAFNTGTQTITAGGGAHRIVLNTDDYDTDTSHYTTDTVLTGTVITSAGSASITGSGTAYTTELSVGQVIMIPEAADGTYPAICVVTVITDDTHITVATQSKPGATESRTDAATMSGAFVARTAGTYLVTASSPLLAPSIVVTQMYSTLCRNGSINYATPGDIMSYDITGVTTTNAPVTNTHSTSMSLNQWDYILFEVAVETAGGNPTTSTNVRPHMEWLKIF